jgi:uncharacterized integral membrane protein
MWTFLKALILLPLAILVVLLAVANRAPVTISLDPFSRETPEIAFALPLFAVIFAAVMLGVLIGGVATWLAQGKYRKAQRYYKREVRHLRSDSERQRPASSASGLPALSSPAPSRY